MCEKRVLVMFLYVDLSVVLINSEGVYILFINLELWYREVVIILILINCSSNFIDGFWVYGCDFSRMFIFLKF